MIGMKGVMLKNAARRVRMIVVAMRVMMMMIVIMITLMIMMMMVPFLSGNVLRRNANLHFERSEKRKLAFLSHWHCYYYSFHRCYSSIEIIRAKTD